MTVEQALQVFENVLPQDGSFISYSTVYGLLMSTAEGRAAVPHIHNLRRAGLIQFKVETDDNGNLDSHIARKQGGE